jgi:DNA-binding transcriptional MerR regulator
MLDQCFSTLEVLRLTGATARQLQWWDEHGVIVPARDGRRRIYSARDLAEILVVMELRRRHISLQQVRRVLRFLKKKLSLRLADLVCDRGEEKLPDYHLLIDGNHLYLETDTRQIFELLRNSAQAVFLISLSETVEKLRVYGGVLIQARESSLAKPPAAELGVSRDEKKMGRRFA